MDIAPLPPPRLNGASAQLLPPMMPPQPSVFPPPSNTANSSPPQRDPRDFYSQDPNDYDDAQDDQLDADGGQGDNKRRRIARACDMCRKKKIKCNGKMPKCSHCENYKTECIFTQVEKKRNPPKGAKYIEGLENRLGRMEGLLRMSGLLAPDDGGRTDLGTLEKRLQEKAMGSNRPSRSMAASPQNQSSATKDAPPPPPIAQSTSGQQEEPNPQTCVTSPEPVQTVTGQETKNEEGVDNIADQMCSLTTNNCGETRYIGSSSGFSIFSPKGIQWVNEKTGDRSFHEMIAAATDEDNKGSHWKPEIFDDLFGRRIFKPLPPKEEAYVLLKDFFQNFNCMFPLFHEPTFMHLVDKHYSLDPYEGSGWWASFNVVLAIAHRLRVVSNVVSATEDEQAWGYLKNAMAVQTELTMRNTDLLSVQALIGMSLFLQGTPNPQPSFFLVAAAIRLAHSIGLHKSGSGFNLNEVEVEQRKRVFWIAYLLDKDICLRSGRPPAQDDDDMNVELPSENPVDNIGNIPLADGKGKTNLFRLMCRFAIIQSRVYKQLYSVKASRQSDGELLNTIGELDQAIEEWKDGIPVDFRPEHDIKTAHTPLILHLVVLHFAYYNCLTTIHRMSVHHGFWTSRLSNYAIQGLNARPLNPRVFMSAALCVNAARTSIGLIKYIPHGDYACVWLILYYPVSALVTLFANILQNAQDARARSDLKLMNNVVNFLSMLCIEESNSSVRRMLSICAEFERIARAALDKAERELKGRGKRKLLERKAEEDRMAPKSLEMLQIETQAPYRRPVATPSLRANLASSSPASNADHWSTPRLGSESGDTSAGNGAPAAAPPWSQQGMFGAMPNSAPSNMAAFAQNRGNSLDSSYYSLSPLNQQQQHHPRPASFSQPQPALQDGLDGAHTFAPGNAMNGLGDFNFSNGFDIPSGADFSANMDSGGGLDGSFNGDFQQPFVPQDLWQMPMTFEWDWQDLGGLGMGLGFEGQDMGFGGGGAGGVQQMGSSGGQ